MKIRNYIVLLLLVMASTSEAALRVSSPLSHKLGLSLTGVEANALTGGDIRTKLGGGGQLHLFYELHKNNFYFNVGIGADYIITNNTLNHYSDAFDRVDFTGEPVLYRYIYSDYRDQHSQLRVVIPMQFGYYIGDWMYVGVGAAFRTSPLLNNYSARTRMLAEGEYERFVQPIRNTEQYGYWPETDYHGNGRLRSVMHEVAVEAEIGIRLPLPTKRFQMRMGVYVGYDMPIGVYKGREMPLADYSNVDINPMTQTWANIQENLQLNSLLDSSVAAHDAHRLRVGVRLSMLLDVTVRKTKCMCLKY